MLSRLLLVVKDLKLSFPFFFSVFVKLFRKHTYGIGNCLTWARMICLSELSFVHEKVFQKIEIWSKSKSLHVCHLSLTWTKVPSPNVHLYLPSSLDSSKCLCLSKILNINLSFISIFIHSTTLLNIIFSYFSLSLSLSIYIYIYK